MLLSEPGELFSVSFPSSGCNAGNNGQAHLAGSEQMGCWGSSSFLEVVDGILVHAAAEAQIVFLGDPEDVEEELVDRAA